MKSLGISLALAAAAAMMVLPAATVRKSSAPARKKAAAAKAKSAGSGGDPLAGLRRVSGATTIECNGSLETLMLLAQLAQPGPAQGEFQEQARVQFASKSNHPAVRETAALIARGFGCRELALLSTFMTQAPYFELLESPELKELAELLPGADVAFNLDRLAGYSKLVREFYWDNRVGQFLRTMLPHYQRALRDATLKDSPPGARIFVSPLCPAATLEFERRTPRPTTYLVQSD